MISSYAPQRDRYELQILNEGTPQATGLVLDKHTDQYLNGPNGIRLMTPQDAHDLHQEYIWS